MIKVRDQLFGDVDMWRCPCCDKFTSYAPIDTSAHAYLGFSFFQNQYTYVRPDGSEFHKKNVVCNACNVINPIEIDIEKPSTVHDNDTRPADNQNQCGEFYIGQDGTWESIGTPDPGTLTIDTDSPFTSTGWVSMSYDSANVTKVTVMKDKPAEFVEVNFVLDYDTL